MLDLIQIELASVRKIAELADDGFLLYLIDMAIQEANQETGGQYRQGRNAGRQAMQQEESH